MPSRSSFQTPLCESYYSFFSFQRLFLHASHPLYTSLPYAKIRSQGGDLLLDDFESLTTDERTIALAYAQGKFCDWLSQNRHAEKKKQNGGLMKAMEVLK